MFIDNKAPELTMGQKLKMFRELDKLSQDELGQKLGVSDKTISDWENGDREITLADSKLICEIFDIPNSYFVFNENYEKIAYKKRLLIDKYIKASEFKKNIETIIFTCKQKIERDGIPFENELLPTFDYERKDFSSLGIFSIESLPITITKTYGMFGESSSNNITFGNIHNNACYKYDSSALAKFGLYDVLERFNGESVEIKDLSNCDSLEIFKNTLLKMKNKKSINFNGGIKNSNDQLQGQLNNVLENLNPGLTKYWEIIIFLIDNGAYYAKQVGSGNDVVSWSRQKDISKTNLVYRIAKDKIEKS